MSNAWFAVGRLTTEYQENPYGLDMAIPRFGWQMQSSSRGEQQQSYQIQVSTAKSFTLAQEVEMVWDSGQVESAQSIHVPYEGKTLFADTIYIWRVRIWNLSGAVSEWSDVALFQMGLTDRNLIKGDWIGLPKDADSQTSSFATARWMRHPQPAPDEQEDRETVFRLKFNLDAAELHNVRLLLTLEGVPEVYVNGQLMFRRGWHTYPRPVWLELDGLLQVGENTLDILCDPSGQAEGSGVALARLTIPATERDYLSGDGWQAAYTLHEIFTDWQERDEVWVAAQAMSGAEEEPWSLPIVYPKRAFSPYRNEASMVRKPFEIKGDVEEAVLYASALGVYEPRLNGQKVGTDVLAPGWTDYHQRVMIQAYNVTDALRNGVNVLAAQLGEGWYAGNVGPFGVDHYGTEPRVWMQLRIKYADGRQDQLATDDTWRISRGPIQFSDIIYGEIYDAREEQIGWDYPGFEETENWQTPKTEKLDKKVLVGQVGPGVQVIETIKAQSIEEKFSGVISIDVGQNISGLLRLRLKGPAGTRVTIRHAEMLHDDGSLFMQNLRGARQTDTYILRGDGEEWYQPYFTFHGFQYADVTGLDYKLTADDIEVQVIHSAIAPRGKLSTSNPLVNQMISNVEWSQRDNFLSIPTDCPQRDERMGWLGDAQIFAPAAAYNMDVSAFFQKWMRDVVDGQLDAGGFPDIAPNVSKLLGGGNAAWADAGVIVPWTMYLMYGDYALLAEMYPSMAKYMDFLETASEEGIRPDAGFGDWLSVGSDTPKDVMQTAYYANSARLMKKIAVVLGEPKDAAQYENTFQLIRKSFQEKFVAADGRIKGNTQSCYVLALQMGLLDENQQTKAVEHLVADIEARDYHLTTGFVSVAHLMPVLTRYGYSDVAMKLLLQETYPGWLYSVHQGATTIWERWDGWTDEKGFQSAGMNSFNHYSFGSVVEWMYRELAGIAPVEDQPGFARLQLRPHPDRSLPVVEASFESVYGLIESHWRYTDLGWEWRVTIPPNVTAQVELPEADPEKLRESGVPLAQADGITSVLQVRDRVQLEAGSGTYIFVKQ